MSNTNYQIMGILNVTPDSFYDGGRYTSLEKAVQHAQSLIAAGATIIDVGGESTRPGAVSVSLEQELARVIPVIQALKSFNCLISIDTYKPEVMQAAIAAGANMVNDVCALSKPGAKEIVAKTGVLACLVHHQPANNIRQIVTDLQIIIDNCLTAHIQREQLIVDPGFGFGKKSQQNLALLNELEQLRELNLPILVGLSHKSMTLSESIQAAKKAIANGAAIIRVHEVDHYCFCNCGI